MRNTRKNPLPLIRLRSLGFTLIEILVTVAIIGVLSGALIFAVNTGNWRRQRVNAVARELAGWIEEVMAYSMRENVSCAIQITTGAQLAAGATAAQVTNPGDCPVREVNFRIPIVVAPAGDRYQLGSFNVDTGGADNVIVYTPRGAVDNDYDIQILIGLLPGGTSQPPVRCIRISNTLGLISIGRNDTAAAPTFANRCVNFDFI